jgi:SAM-dependent methyltransferase
MTESSLHAAASQLRVSLDLLRCPATGGRLRQERGFLVTSDGDRRYRVVDRVPILIAPELSAVDVQKYTGLGQHESGSGGLLRRLAHTLLRRGPSLSLNVRAARNYSRLGQLLAARVPSASARVLVVGGATEGDGFDALIRSPGLELVDVDLAIGPRTKVVCDAHHLPFADATFDAVVAQAVLEHVSDPHRAVAEIHRVLAPEGIVYSEIPFMQQVHEGMHDVTRYTLLGHRRLYTWFDEIDSGVATGPAMALLWSVRYFLVAFTNSPAARALMTRVISISLFWVKYLDYYLADRPGAADAASGTFFLGIRRSEPVPEQAILDGYRGAVRNPSVTSRS